MKHSIFIIILLYIGLNHHCVDHNKWYDVKPIIYIDTTIIKENDTIHTEKFTLTWKGNFEFCTYRHRLLDHHSWTTWSKGNSQVSALLSDGPYRLFIGVRYKNSLDTAHYTFPFYVKTYINSPTVYLYPREQIIAPDATEAHITLRTHLCDSIKHFFISIPLHIDTAYINDLTTSNKDNHKLICKENVLIYIIPPSGDPITSKAELCKIRFAIPPRDTIAINITQSQLGKKNGDTIPLHKKVGCSIIRSPMIQNK